MSRGFQALFCSYVRSRKKGKDRIVGRRERVAQPNSNPTKKLFFLYKAMIMADVRKRTADTCSMYHDEPTEAMNQKQVPKPKRAVSHRALLPFVPVFLSISQITETHKLARIIDNKLWSKDVPKAATKGIRRTAGIGG